MVNAMLDALFVSKSRIAILKTMLLEPGKRFYLRELAQKADVPLRSVQIEVKRLTNAEILVCERDGRQTYYRMNERCPILAELRSMFIKTVGIADAVRKVLSPESASISAAFIYGSYARGEIRAESDIDLFVVGDTTLRRLTSLLRKTDIMRAINPTVMSREEFKSRLTQGDHFTSAIMNSPKLFLIGEEDGLQRPD